MADEHSTEIGDLLSSDEVLAAAEPFDPCCGIYFLVYEDEIVYVGQSVNCYGRVAQHMSDKVFDRVAMMDCPPDELDYWESRYILHFSPKYNGRAKGGRLLTPLTRHALNDGVPKRVTASDLADAVRRLPALGAGTAAGDPN